MIVPDVNVLVYAFVEAADDHDRYHRWLTDVVSGSDELGLIDSVLVGFVRIVTNPRIISPAVSAPMALNFVDELRGAARVRMLDSSPAVWDQLSAFVAGDRGLTANLIPDAYIAAHALAHGGRVATSDRGFSRYPGLRWFDPAKGAA